MEKKQEVFIIGAGRLGKGFIGEVFEAANWQVTFLDKDPQVVAALNQGPYQVEISTTEEIYTREVTNYQTFLTDDSHPESDSFLTADVVMVPVYPEDLPEVFSYLLADFQLMRQQAAEKKLDIILLTNQTYLVPKMYQYLKDQVDAAFYTWIEDHLFIKDAIIRRSTDGASAAARKLFSMAAASLLIETPLHVDLAAVNWMEPTKNVPLLKEIKIYTLNGPHAATAFIGHYTGYSDIPSTEADQENLHFIQEVAKEINQACIKEYNLTQEELTRLSAIPKLKGEVPDSIRRVAFDPIRKLSLKDRLCGPILLCEKHQLPHSALDKAVALGFKYEDEEDSNSLELQKLIADLGIAQAVEEVTGLDPQLVANIVKEYEKL